MVAQAERTPSIRTLASGIAYSIIQPFVQQLPATTAHPSETPWAPPYLREFSLPSRLPVTIVSGDAEVDLGQTSDCRTYYDGTANTSSNFQASVLTTGNETTYVHVFVEYVVLPVTSMTTNLYLVIVWHNSAPKECS